MKLYFGNPFHLTAGGGVPGASSGAKSNGAVMAVSSAFLEPNCWAKIRRSATGLARSRPRRGTKGRQTSSAITASLWPNLAQLAVGLCQLSAAQELHGLDQRAGGVAGLFLESLVAVELGGMAGRDQTHVLEPVDQDAPQRLAARGIAMDDDRKDPAGEMARIVPALHLEVLGLLRVLARRRGRVGI